MTTKTTTLSKQYPNPFVDQGRYHVSPSTTTHRGVQNLEHGFLPIPVVNFYSEEGCHFEYDNIQVVNFLRVHYLQHLGQHQLGRLVDDYQDEATLIRVTNAITSEGTRKILRRAEGLEEIRMLWKNTFDHEFVPTKNDPETNETCHFQLHQMVVTGNHAMVVWSALTPTSVFPQSSDTFVFSGHEGSEDDTLKIVLEFSSCQINPLDKL